MIFSLNVKFLIKCLVLAPIKGLGTDHVISEPIRGIKRQKDRQTDSMIESAQWVRGGEVTATG